MYHGHLHWHWPHDLLGSVYHCSWWQQEGHGELVPLQLKLELHVHLLPQPQSPQQSPYMSRPVLWPDEFMQ